MCIIIDNGYSRHTYPREEKTGDFKTEGNRKRAGDRGEGEEEEAYLFLFVPIFNVEFIARYTGNDGKDSTSKRR